MAQLFFAMHRGQDEENRHIVSLGKDYPVTYLMGEDQRVFKRRADNSLQLLTDAELAQKPWIRTNILREIRGHLASRIAVSNAKYRNRNKFLA